MSGVDVDVDDVVCVDIDDVVVDVNVVVDRFVV